MDAPVIDGFRAPATRFAAGNRGLEYGLTEETDIRAVDGGRVRFAGRVGNELFVTIDHGGGLVSTSAYLTSVRVVRGQQIAAGDVVGTAGKGFHLTARLDGVYLDPSLLIAGIDIGVALVGGLAGPGGARPAERNAGEGEIGRGRFDSTLALAHAADSLRPSALIVATAEAAQAWHHLECTAVQGHRGVDSAGRVVDLRPADNGNRVLIQVGGLGSSSEDASIGRLDPLALGYGPDEVKGFSYAGGCTDRPFGFPQPGLQFDGHVALDYGPEDTYQDIDVSAARLAEVIEAAADARPDARIDIAAHSLGGVVTRRAVELVAQRGRTKDLGVVVTIGSPHAGADLATIASAAAGGLDVVDHLGKAGELRHAASVIQLSEVGQHSIGPAPQPPTGVVAVAIAGSADPVVPAPAAIWGGATNVLVNLDNPAGAHTVLPGTSAVHDAFVLAMAGAPPACVGLADVLAGSAAGSLISTGESGAAVAAGIARWLL